MQKFVAGEFSAEHQVSALLQELLAMDDCNEGCLEISGAEVNGLIGVSREREIVAAQVTPDGPSGTEALQLLLHLENGNYIFHEGRFVEGEEISPINRVALAMLSSEVKIAAKSHASLPAQAKVQQDDQPAIMTDPSNAHLPSEHPATEPVKKDFASTSGLYDKLKTAIALESKTNLLALSKEEGQLIAGKLTQDPTADLPIDLAECGLSHIVSDNVSVPALDKHDQALPGKSKAKQEARSKRTGKQAKAQKQRWAKNPHITAHLLMGLKDSDLEDTHSPEFFYSTGVKDSEAIRRSKTTEVESAKAQERQQRKISRRQLEVAISAAIVFLTPGIAYLSWSAIDEMVQIQRTKGLYNQGKLSIDQCRDLIVITDKSLKMHPDSAKLHYYRGLALRQLGMAKESLREFAIGLKLLPRDPYLLDEYGYTEILLGDYQNAINAYNTLLEDNLADKKTQAPNAYGKRAFAFMNLSNFKAAREDLLKVRASVYDKKSVALQLALCNAELGKFSEAKALVEEALKGDAKDPGVYTTLGRVLTKSKEYQEADVALSKSIALDPTPDAYLALAELAQAKNNSKRMIDAYTQYLVFNPNDRNILWRRARLYVQQGELEKALTDFNTAAAAKHVGDDYFFYAERGDLLVAMGKLDLAIDDYKKAKAAKPRDKSVRVKLAQCFEKRTEYMKASDVYSSLLLDDPNNVEFLMKRGHADMETGHFSTASRDFEKAVHLTQGDPLKQEKAYFARGLNCFKQGIYQGANVDFDNVLKLNQHNAEAKALKLLIASRDKKPIEKSLPGPAPLEIDEHASPTELVKSGYTLMQAGDNESAIKFFAKAIQRQPNNVEARRYLAYSLLADKGVVPRKPKDESSIPNQENSRNVALSSEAMRNEALNQFAGLEKMAALNEEDIYKYVELLTAVGRRDKVVTVLQSFLKDHPDDLKARVDLADTFVTLNKMKEFQKTCIEGMKLAKTNEDYDLFRSLLMDTAKKLTPHAKTQRGVPDG